eukprot:CAMPEP_0180532654 /NCGR_PEP_ID=MMETSP1036_2-20121128/63180_1 /TAXON_ID=632150 /ORGANISM="Azadinium spinosum, Strain 3D9" /LENGTH=40 /DNA_ID= /DNA_START= /DNA_END= /DNA_ORIENTATION=
MTCCKSPAGAREAITVSSPSATLSATLAAALAMQGWRAPT